MFAFFSMYMRGRYRAMRTRERSVFIGDLRGKRVRLNGIAASAGSKGGVVQAFPAREC